MSPSWIETGRNWQSDLQAELQYCNSPSAWEECGTHLKSGLQAVVSVVYVCNLL